MNVACQCVFQNREPITLTACVRFSLIRERYQPYALLHAVFLLDTLPDEQPVSAVFSINGQTVHEGIVQDAECMREGGEYLLRLHSRSYTVLLTGNQLVPRMYTNVTLSSLMTTYQLPHITYESDIPQINYVYVKEHAGMWNAIVAYNYKLCRGYPFIRVPNQLCVMPRQDSNAFTVPDAAILGTGNGTDTTQIISRVDMADIDRVYGKFSEENPEAAAYGIVRVRQMPFDQQYLYNPGEALRFRIACSNRRLRRKTLTYAGYCGEDLEDLVTAAAIGSARVSRIVINGDAKGIVTKDTFYFDSFCNRAADET